MNRSLTIGRFVELPRCALFPVPFTLACTLGEQDAHHSRTGFLLLPPSSLSPVSLAASYAIFCHSLHSSTHAHNRASSDRKLREIISLERAVEAMLSMRQWPLVLGCDHHCSATTGGTTQQVAEEAPVEWPSACQG